MRNIFDFVKATAKAVKAKVSTVTAAVRRKICRTHAAVRTAAFRLAVRSNTMLAANFVDSGIKILIAVVIGALLLGGLYALFGDTIMPTVTEKVEEMFEFNG